GMNGTGKKLFLECNVIVGRGGLLLSAGYIQIGNFDLTIRNDRHIYSITAAADPTPSYVITNGMGRLIQREVGPGGLSTAVFYPIGTLTACLPISVINTGTRDHFGARVFDQVFTAGTSGFAYTSGVVNATWMFDEQTLGGSIIAMALRWKTAQELPSFNRAQCYVSHFDGPTWDSQALGASTITSGYFQRTRAGITNFSPFAVLGSTPLPVEFTSFTVSRDNLEDKIKWSTEREEKLTHFEVQRSIDGYNFVALGKVFPRMNYEFITASTQVDRCYYRIAAIDLDGTINYTEVVEIQSQKTWDFYSSGNKLVFQNKSAEKLELLVDIYSVSGEKVSEEKILLEDHTMRDFSLPAGLFIVSVASYETTVVKKLFIY
ncbi:MAG TPA: hypothetical protein PKC14_03175, partial [Candidatus Absconditabacterales bacterium]|nr:hypothetical protein [Candidatus Absconditabacterales bacterium]